MPIPLLETPPLGEDKECPFDQVSGVRRECRWCRRLGAELSPLVFSPGGHDGPLPAEHTKVRLHEFTHLIDPLLFVADSGPPVLCRS